MDEVCTGDGNREDTEALADVDWDERDLMAGRCAWCDDLGLQNAETLEALMATDKAVNKEVNRMVSLSSASATCKYKDSIEIERFGE